MKKIPKLEDQHVVKYANYIITNSLRKFCNQLYQSDEIIQNYKRRKRNNTRIITKIGNLHMLLYCLSLFTKLFQPEVENQGEESVTLEENED